jgi:hypothetical protein
MTPKIGLYQRIGGQGSVALWHTDTLVHRCGNLLQANRIQARGIALQRSGF